MTDTPQEHTRAQFAAAQWQRELPQMDTGAMQLVGQLGTVAQLMARDWLNPLFAEHGLQPGEFIHTFGDAHLYRNHFEQAELQLSRTPRPLPTMTLNPDVADLFDFKFENFELSGYDPHPHIKAAVAV